jgi:hypothetical protein
MKLKKYGDAVIAANRFKDKGVKKEMSDGTIIVEIHGARLIRNVQMLSDQDPYVIVTLQPEGTISYRTKVAQFGGTDPDWGRVHDNVMTFELNGTADKLALEIWNENYVSEDDFIGGVEINLAGQASDRSFKRKSFNVDTGGKLILSIRHQSCAEHDDKWAGEDAAPQRMSNASAKADSRKERRKRQAEEEQLKVEVLKGYNLQEATMLTEQEPYVMATMLPLREISRRTNCVETAFGEEQHSGTNPEWTQEHRNLLMLQVEPESEGVLLEVWAQNSLGGDDLLGSAEVVLRDIPFLQNEKQKLKLDTGGELEVNFFRQAAMSNIVDQFMKELQVGDTSRKLRSLGALCTLALNEASPDCMFQRGTLGSILPLLQVSSSTPVRVEAAKFFANLSAHDTSPGNMLNSGVVKAVVQALTEADLHTASDMRSQTDSEESSGGSNREPELELDFVKALMTVLMNVAADDETPPLMVEEGVCQAIMPFLHVHQKVTEHCIRCLANLSYHADTPQVMVLQGVAGAIAPLLHSQTEQIQAFTAEALVNLSAHSETPVRMVEDKIVLMTLPLLKSRSGSVEMKLDIVQTLANLCYHKDTKVSMMEQGVCSAVLPLLQSESSELRSTCSEVLLYLSTHEDVPLKMLNEGVCAAMEPLLHSDNAELRSNCAQTIMNVVRPLAIRT